MPAWDIWKRMPIFAIAGTSDVEHVHQRRTGANSRGFQNTTTSRLRRNVCLFLRYTSLRGDIRSFVDIIMFETSLRFDWHSAWGGCLRTTSTSQWEGSFLTACLFAFSESWVDRWQRFSRKKVANPVCCSIRLSRSCR